MDKKSLKDMLEIFLTLQVTKELPRQGFLYSGFKRNEADSVAAHSFNVAAFAYFLARELKARGTDVDVDRTLRVALLHDMGEAITGDMGTFVKDMSGGVFEEVENKAVKLLFRNASNKEELMELFQEYQKLESLESQIVKVGDALDALAQGVSTPSANMKDWVLGMARISKTKIKDKKLKKIFDDCVNIITKKEVTYFRGHIDKASNNQTKL